MTAAAGNFVPLEWFQGLPVRVRRPSAGTIAAGKRAFIGALQLAVNGVLYPLVSGTTLAALCTLAAGADANGGSYYRSNRQNVTIQHISGGAESIAVTYGSTIAVALTYNNGTSTALTIAKLVRQNAECQALGIKTKAQGTGASSPAAVAATAIAHIVLEGVAKRDINNSAGGSALALASDDVFEIGNFGLLPESSALAPAIDSRGYLLDDQTVSKTADPLNLSGIVRGKRGDSLLYYVDLDTVE